MKFQIVDAFTRQTFGGNPAGVVLLPEGADFPADETMRKTAAELRYSETAFIKPLGGNRFHIRYFTPAAEVELCGHATIGSFHALQEMGLVAEGGTYIDETLSGTLEVVVGKDAILMDMAKPQAFQRLETPEELEELYALSPADRAVIHLHYYQGYSTGEIAQLLGQRPGTVRARLFRARGRLKRLLEGESL